MKTNINPDGNFSLSSQSKSVPAAPEVDARAFRPERNFWLGFSLWSHRCRPGLGKFALERVLLRTLEASVENKSLPSFLDGPTSLDRRRVDGTVFSGVGLEIKREIVKGELSSFRQAALPIMAALGGMVLPALLYFSLNQSGPGARGWGIPMATDIGFAMGVLALLGKRIPSSLRVFMLALAIVDDVGAILVIAFFYTPKISLSALAAAGGLLALLVAVAMRRAPISVYMVVGFFFWAAVLSSGVHATIAGVILGLIAPIKPKFRPEELAESAEPLLRNFRTQISSKDKSSAEATLTELDQLLRGTDSIAERLERSVHPWVCFLVLPLFALASAGVALSTEQLKLAFSSPIALGIFLGLVVGKAVGITAFSFLAVQSTFAEMADGLTWAGIAGIGILAGLGFTVALFISGLSFADETSVATAKIAVLAASLAAGIIGYFCLRLSLKDNSVRS